jgi:hypothetical protein
MNLLLQGYRYFFEHKEEECTVLVEINPGGRENVQIGIKFGQPELISGRRKPRKELWQIMLGTESMAHDSQVGKYGR